VSAQIVADKAALAASVSLARVYKGSLSIWNDESEKRRSSR
jgi:hypothetical protein